MTQRPRLKTAPVKRARPEDTGVHDWVSVGDWLPECSDDPKAFGVAVLIWPRDAASQYGPSSPTPESVMVYYGCRATGNRRTFYIHGAVQEGITHWRYLPKGPTK